MTEICTIAMRTALREGGASAILTSMWELVLPGVYLFRDSCNVYAVEGPDGVVVINAGTGEWLESMSALPANVVALACTHYFRDHSAGAHLAAKHGIPVFVPEYEDEVFADPEQHFRQRESYIVYDNLWDRFSPILPTPIAGVLRDYDSVELGGLKFEVIPLPGVTCGQIGLATNLPHGGTTIFCAEAIHSPGRLARIAPLQYNYNDLSGALNVHESAGRLIEHAPDALLPSLGDPILRDTSVALRALQLNLEALAAPRPWLSKAIAELGKPDLEQITPHVWLDRKSVANTWYVISDSGKVMALDYGYSLSTASAFPNYPKKDRRRALLHGLSALKRQLGIERIDVVLVSHFHDDHVCGIPVLQRLHGTECWAADNFADLLECPEAHTFPCGWPVPITVERRLSLSAPFEWEGIQFHLAPMSGHTRFAALIGFEIDGKRFAHTGDQYFFENGVETFEGNSRSQNHVFRNGALLDGYEQSGKWMLDWRPDIVLQGHQPAMHSDDHFFAHVEKWTKDYAELARAVMPLGDVDTHFDLDSMPGWIWPYRIVQTNLETFDVSVTIRNPLPVAADLELRLVGPENWSGSSATVPAGPREEVRVPLSITPTSTGRRLPIAVELRANGQPFGQFAEALVTIGNDGVW